MDAIELGSTRNVDVLREGMVDGGGIDPTCPEEGPGVADFLPSGCVELWREVLPPARGLGFAVGLNTVPPFSADRKRVRKGRMLWWCCALTNAGGHGEIELKGCKYQRI